MSRTAKDLLIAGCVVAGLLALGCKADTKGLATLTVPELARLLDEHAPVVACDANNSTTRSRYGIIPGARLLSNYGDYDPAGELPADKGRKLVFYCHSEWCSAGAAAARRAVAAGYTDVHVLPAGIKGWVAASQPVEKHRRGGGPE